MNRITYAFLALNAHLLLGYSHPAHAQVTYFPNDATINSALLGDVEIGQDFQRNPSSPTVNLVTSGSISGFAYVYNNSQFNISGGSIGGSIDARDTSAVMITGGSIGSGLQANDNSVINLHGGSFAADLYANDNSAIHFFGSDLKATVVTNFGGFTDYTLSGKLEDGTDLSARQLFVQSTASFTLSTVPSPHVPEPGAWALAAGSGVSLLGMGYARRKTNRTRRRGGQI